MEKLEFKFLYNVAYSPSFNPIELCFSALKRHFYKARSAQMVRGQDPDITIVLKARI